MQSRLDTSIWVNILIQMVLLMELVIRNLLLVVFMVEYLHITQDDGSDDTEFTDMEISLKFSNKSDRYTRIFVRTGFEKRHTDAYITFNQVALIRDAEVNANINILIMMQLLLLLTVTDYIR